MSSTSNADPVEKLTNWSGVWDSKEAKKCASCELHLAQSPIIRQHQFLNGSVVVKWSACLPSSPRSELESCCSLQFFCKIVVEKKENKHKDRPGLAH